MKSFFKNLPSIGLSLLINVSVLAALYCIHRSMPVFAKEVLLESIFTEEMPQEEMTRDLQLDTTPAETLNVIAGGTPSTVVGASAQPAAAAVNVQKAAVMKEVNIRPVTTDVALPSDEMLGQELGEGEIVGEGAFDRRKYDSLSMREYQPNLVSRPEYIRDRSTSHFRETIWRVIFTLNPNGDKLLFQSSDPELNIQNEHFPLAVEGFRSVAAAQVVKAARAMQLIEQAVGLLEKVKPLRASEATQRWRAGYDLSLAQLYIFRLRLYQYLLAMDKHVNEMPQPKNPKAHEWNLWWNTQTIVPDDAQFSRLKDGFALKMSRDEYLEMVKTEEAASIERMRIVIVNHSGTPWARRAQTELDMGFGFVVVDRLWDPSGQRSEAQKRVPNL